METAIILERWLHITAGILWVGLLYFFNLVQMPAITARINLVLSLPLIYFMSAQAHIGF